MSTQQDGGPAFPGGEGGARKGMSLRDYFAAKAMQAFISAYPCQAIDRADGGILVDYDCISWDAYQMADAMLEAREEQE